MSPNLHRRVILRSQRAGITASRQDEAAMALIALDSGAGARPDLWARAASLPPGAPIIIMLHGYRFSPERAETSPHRHILSLDPDPRTRRAVSWPAALGFTADGNEGLAIAHGWPALGRFRQAHARASRVGADLAGLIDRLALAAQRPVAMIGHSLGGRVALSALRRATPGAVGRVILLSAAELRHDAEAAIASPAGMLADVVNVTSRENDPYDLGLELLLSAGRHSALGFGLDRPRGNWLDLQIDDDSTLDGLRALGFPIARGASRACHWSPYLRRGLFDVWRAILCTPAELPLASLARCRPEQPSRRWSRLLAPPFAAGAPQPTPGPLSFGAESA
ncbi:alpha/beta fold hydrolase [Paracoccus sp. MC1862]|uniref:alpha/beta fold hydrolase n=1 Tax=Paracoccus sp. MC1862 TaxID=2760307 RepID=UPI0016004FEE|nr:alpha/beta fold hydrolase [Paracoccus sp. MC1862]MBB1496957.1 alpha/beta fold hydrolase [Paracoccus sp. MC1862]QQO45576.1 alpha/beta fold hydrolase [Paracoccus sp. MC1862]